MNIDFMFRNLFCKLIAFIFMNMGWLCFIIYPDIGNKKMYFSCRILYCKFIFCAF